MSRTRSKAVPQWQDASAAAPTVARAYLEETALGYEITETGPGTAFWVAGPLGYEIAATDDGTAQFWRMGPGYSVIG